MILNALTVIHVALSLIAIGAGLAVARGLLTSKPPYPGTNLFLTTTAATSATGFLFPFHGVTPGQIVGLLSLIALALAGLALYRHHLAGGWYKMFAITAIIALYFNVFVLVVQLFEKVGPLRKIAPTQSEPPFQAAQLAILVLFAAIGTRAATRGTLVAQR